MIKKKTGIKKIKSAKEKKRQRIIRENMLKRLSNNPVAGRKT